MNNKVSNLTNEIDLSPALSFRDASRTALEYLRAQTGLAMWMVTRTEGKDWLVLETSEEEQIYPVHPGDLLKWTDTFCQYVVSGEAPQIACDAQKVDLFAQAPISKRLKINAYVGIPILDRDGDLFGTVCGIDPSVQPDSFSSHLPLCQLLARLLGGHLALEMQLLAANRKSDRQSLRLMVDPATGLFNSQGWHRLVRREASRSAGLSRPPQLLRFLAVTSSVSDLAKMVLDLDDELTSEFFAARLGPERFEILLPGHDAMRAEVRAVAITERLKSRGVQVGHQILSLEKALADLGDSETDPSIKAVGA